MSAYFIFTKEKTLDQHAMDIYMQKVQATFAGHPVKILAAYGPHEVIEGEATEGVVVAEFPSVEAAKAWYESPAYQEVRAHRFQGARYRAILVQGV